MLKRFLVLFVLFLPCASNACGCGVRYRPPVAHAMRDYSVVMNPVAKHPIMPRRVATARRRIRY